MKTRKWILLAPRRTRTVPVGNPAGALRVNLLGWAASGILVPGMLFAGLSTAPSAIHGYHDGHHARTHQSSHMGNGVSNDAGAIRIPWMY